MLCKVYPNSRWAIVRKDLPTLKRNTIPSFQKIVPRSFMKSYNQDTQTVKFTNGSEIMFFAENYAQDKDLNRKIETINSVGYDLPSFNCRKSLPRESRISWQRPERSAY